MLDYFMLSANKAKSVGEVIDGTDKAYGFGDAKNYFDIFKPPKWKSLDTRVLWQYQLVPLFTLIAVTLIIIVVVLLILQAHGITHGLSQRAIKNEVQHYKWIQKRDKRILRRARFSINLQKFMNKHNLGLSTAQKSYLEYNLLRAKVMDLTGRSIMLPGEYNALIKFSQIICTLLGVVLTVKYGLAVGIGVILIGCTLLGKVPEAIIRGKVRNADEVIKSGFFGLYGEIHYTLLQRSDTPLKRVVRQYGKMDLPEEIKDFANDIADEFDMYGDTIGARHIAQKYREINEVSKLMRLIQQYADGGDIGNDLKGFRQALLVQRRIREDKKSEKVMRTCRRAMVVVYIILVQVAISTLANTLPDLLSFKGLLGG